MEIKVAEANIRCEMKKDATLTLDLARVRGRKTNKNTRKP
jgi:hypothetical protein